MKRISLRDLLRGFTLRNLFLCLCQTFFTVAKSENENTKQLFLSLCLSLFKLFRRRPQLRERWGRRRRGKVCSLGQGKLPASLDLLLPNVAHEMWGHVRLYVCMCVSIWKYVCAHVRVMQRLSINFRAPKKKDSILMWPLLLSFSWKFSSLLSTWRKKLLRSQETGEPQEMIHIRPKRTTKDTQVERTTYDFLFKIWTDSWLLSSPSFRGLPDIAKRQRKVWAASVRAGHGILPFRQMVHPLFFSCFNNGQQ